MPNAPDTTEAHALPERVTEERVAHPGDVVLKALTEADSALADGLSALRPFANDDDDSYQLSDLVEDARHDLAAARRKAHRVVRDHDRRAVADPSGAET